MIRNGGILGAPSSKRRSLVSRYHRIEWEGVRVNVSPAGWWRPWGLRTRPFQTGDQIPLRVEIKGTQPKGITSIQLAVARESSPVDYLEAVVFEAKAQPILRFRTQPLGLSGEYTITMLLLGPDTNQPTRLTERYQKLAATIQVRTNLALLWAIGAVAVAGMTLLGVWLKGQAS